MPGQPPLLALGVAIFGLHLGVCLFARPLACVPASVPVRARLVPFVFRGFLGQLHLKGGNLCQEAPRQQCKDFLKREVKRRVQRGMFRLCSEFEQQSKNLKSTNMLHST